MLLEIFMPQNVKNFHVSQTICVFAFFRIAAWFASSDPHACSLVGGQEESLPYNEFDSKEDDNAITGLEQWRCVCGVDPLFC